MKKRVKKNHAVWIFNLLVAAFCCSHCALGKLDSPDSDTQDSVDSSSEDPCPPGLTFCAGWCVDTSSDHEHCGRCGLACDPSEVCAGSECTLECPADKTNCGGSCVDVSTNIAHCGDCDHPCPSGAHEYPLCTEGACSVECHPGWIDTDGDGSCETNCVYSSSLPSLSGESNHGDITWSEHDPGNTLGDPDDNFGCLRLFDTHGGCGPGDWFFGSAAWTWSLDETYGGLSMKWRVEHGYTQCTDSGSSFMLEGSMDGSNWTLLWRQTFSEGGSGYDSGILTQSFEEDFRHIRARIASQGKDEPGTINFCIDFLQICRKD